MVPWWVREDGEKTLKDRPYLGLSCPVWHLEKTRCDGRAVGWQKMWDVKASQTSPHTSLQGLEEKGRRREDE